MSEENLNRVCYNNKYENAVMCNQSFKTRRRKIKKCFCNDAFSISKRQYLLLVIFYVLVLDFQKKNVSAAQSEGIEDIQWSSWPVTTPSYWSEPEEDDFPSTWLTQPKLPPLSLPSNLSMKAFRRGEGNKLHLNVTWDPPADNKMFDYYSIYITSTNTTSKPCPTNLCYEDRISDTATWIAMPYDLDLNQGHCTIQPGCSYTALLTVHAGRHIYRISTASPLSLPDCVDDICCLRKSDLPRPRVTVTNAWAGANVTFNVSWSMPVSAKEKVSWYTVQCYIQLKSGISFQWLGPEYNISSTKSSGWISITKDLKAGRSYRARVRPFDDRGCPGIDGNFTFKVEEKKPDDVPYFLILWKYWLVLVLLILACLAGALGTRACKAPCRLKQMLQARLRTAARSEPNLSRQQAWPSTYSPVHSVQTSITTARQCSEAESPIYIEKEISEARLRGEVDEWEVSKNRITFGPKVGEGAFGRVYRAKTTIPGYPQVAVKKLRSRATSDEIQEFLGEIAMLKRVGRHPHVVALVGCCTLTHPYCALLEYAPGGDLAKHLIALRTAYVKLHTCDFMKSSSILDSSYIQNNSSSETNTILPTRPSATETEYTFIENEVNRIPGQYIQREKETSFSEAGTFALDSVSSLDSMSVFTHQESVNSAGGMCPKTEDGPSPLAPGDLHSYALQIAKGMEHLEKKGITHRDLAARNVLLTATGTLKVSDLGLSRTGVYVPTLGRQQKVPLRWLALEAARYSIYTSKSDVWAYAVLLWEIGTLGAFPYPTLRDSEVVSYLASGRRLSKPDIASEELYSTMMRCWAEQPDLRPSFSELVTLLEADDGIRNKAYVDLGSLKEFIQLPPTENDVLPDYVVQAMQSETKLLAERDGT